LREKYPTAGLAVINFASGLWSSVAVNSGTLTLFLSPRELKG
jgi:phosphohistidine phosphatase